MQSVGTGHRATGYTGMIETGLYGEAWPSCASVMPCPPCLMLSATPCLGFEALII
jgi:hypothetical protein